MAIDTDAYGTVVGVQALVGDLVSDRTFTVGSTPSLAQVELAVNEIGAEINMELETAGYTVPVSAADDVNMEKWLQGINNMGAAARSLSYVPAESVLEPGEENPVQSRRGWYQREFERALKRIRTGLLKASRDQTRMANMVTGAQQDSDGNTKLPIFTRETTRHPTSLPSLTEP